MLLFPAIRNSREGTRQNICQNNQHQLFVLASTFSGEHGEFFPKIDEKDHGGAFVAQLITGEYTNNKNIAVWLICPSSPLADKIRSGQVVFQLPTAEQIRAMAKTQRDRFTAQASPCYAYTLPKRVDHVYRYVKNDHSPLTPVFSDATSDGANDPMTPNHRGAVVQVQFAGGNVRTLTSWKLPLLDDDLSHNDLGYVAAGVRQNDIVMGNSDVTPGEELAELRK
jgi:hypothetical protein